MANKKPPKQPEAAEPENVVPLKVVKPSKLDKFKSKRKAGIAGLETVPEMLPIIKIGDARDFVRLHPDEESYWSPELCFVSVPIPGEKKDQLHIIEEDLAMRWLSNGKIQRFRLALASKPHNVLFLCKVPSVHLDNQWNSDAVKACKQAKTHWVQVASRREENKDGYKTDLARDQDAFPAPVWPTTPLEDLIELAFHGAAIENEDHEGFCRVVGKRQNVAGKKPA